MTAEVQPLNPPVSREIFEDRWDGAVDGDDDSDYGDLFSADGLALVAILNRLIGKVARVPSEEYSDTFLVDGLILEIRAAIINRVDEHSLAR